MVYSVGQKDPKVRSWYEKDDITRKGEESSNGAVGTLHLIQFEPIHQIIGKSQ
jgi:hypothetical protein